MGYISDHWRGRHALTRAFWINFLAPFVLIAAGVSWFHPVVLDRPYAGTVAAAIYILLGYGIILPWQLVGLWRSSRRHLQEQGDSTTATFAQSAVLVALLAAAGITATAAERIFMIGGEPAESPPSTPRYALTYLPDDHAILIDGPFDVGLSRDLRAMLAEADDIEAIVLDSDGGRIFEARGVAKQILDHGLDTYVFGRCRSACTLAFVAGASRKLGTKGTLGFHSYELRAVIGFIDPLEEQEKDKAFFLDRGVSPDFVTRIFETPHDAMWHPDADRLRAADVVHEIVTGP
ncbi:MAG: hypothetical protein R3F54_11560 [Alphaproteobacteria bacterium]